MKKVLGVIIGIVAIIWIALKIFGKYDSNAVLYNQASFEIYLDTKNLDINEYFGMIKDTFDIQKHKIVCLLPVEVQGFKPTSTLVRNDLNNIDCNATIKNSRIIDYEPYELKGSTFTFIIMNKNASTQALNLPLGGAVILSKKRINHNYSKGKINRLVLSEYGLNEHCK
ncbi:hypothetical protein JCM19314_1466 [Nonlabens ulvanivorans]|uniref:Uncharacterized protein n=1 Tax=Nonlabens ulvanivorans TaxID=906888 RepID=A0A090R339_NONUL|nr:hypothetical protein [Nonlabens ulvanivorans]GAL02052.1 hypothetical protein JCM19314_1466 [Nonlabens ulvanivorans]